LRALSRPSVDIVLVDTMIVIEAVDTDCWNAITGQLFIATSIECAEELRRGESSRPGYVPVTERDILRATVLDVSDEAKVEFGLRYPDSHRLDAGERDLLTIAAGLTDGFRLCSCDKAAVVAANSLGLLDHLVSLERLAAEVGVRPRRALRRQYTDKILRLWRTSLTLEQRL